MNHSYLGEREKKREKEGEGERRGGMNEEEKGNRGKSFGFKPSIRINDSIESFSSMKKEVEKRGRKKGPEPEEEFFTLRKERREK